MRERASADRPTRREATRTRTDFQAEIGTLTREAFDAMAHELGNAATPVCLIAAALALNASPERVRASARTLDAVGERLRALTMISRTLGTIDFPMLPATGGTSVDLRDWWTTFSPIVEIVLPASQQLSVDLSAQRTTVATIRLLTRALPAVAHFLVLSAPASPAIAITSSDELMDTTRIVCTVDTAVIATSRHTKRWLAFARHMVRERGGTIQIAKSVKSMRVTVTIPQQ